MIYIRYDKPTNQGQTKQSAYLSFRWDQFILDKIKALNTRYWIPDSKEWEIPTNLLDKVYEISNVQFMNEPSEELSRKIDDSLFVTEPLTHQVEGVQYGLDVNSWLLGDQQGLGKTKQIIDLAVQRKHQDNVKHCLIICGINNLKYNWLEEVKKHSDEDCCIIGKKKASLKSEPSGKKKLEHLRSIPEEFFWITNIETLRMEKVETEASKKRNDPNNKTYKYVSELVDLINHFISTGELSLIVVDEIHRAKNPTSGQGRGLLSLKGCPKIGLSGTLLVNKPMDLYMPLRFIDAINMGLYQFMNKFTIKDNWGAVVGYQNMGELQALMDQHMLRRTKALLDLPPKIHTTEYLEMDKDEKRLYNEILEATKQECDLIEAPVSKLAKLIRMRQVCCHTGLVSSSVFKSTKFLRLYDILDEAKANNEKVIVFSMFRELIELALEEYYEYDPLYIWGQMNQQELAYQRDTFQNSDGFKVLFGVIQAAGTGITLNAASTVVFLDLPWNRATMEQAEDRAHRIGTKGTVNVISLLLKDTYDEILNKMVIQKGQMGDVLIDGKDTRVFATVFNTIFKNKGEFDYD